MNMGIRDHTKTGVLSGPPSYMSSIRGPSGLPKHQSGLPKVRRESLIDRLYSVASQMQKKNKTEDNLSYFFDFDIDPDDSSYDANDVQLIARSSDHSILYQALFT